MSRTFFFVPLQKILRKQTNRLTTFMHFAHLLHQKAARHGRQQILFSRNNNENRWTSITWRQFDNLAQQTAAALIGVGTAEHENIGIYSQNMPETLFVDFANFAIRTASVPIYATNSAKQLEYIVDDAEIATLFVGEQVQYDNALQVIQTSKFLKRIVVFDPTTDLKKEQRACFFSDFIANGNTADNNKTVERRRREANENDLAILMYTSGTTGEPKGVMLPHRSLTEAMRLHDKRILHLSHNDRSVSFLPLTHIFERGWTYFCLYRNAKIYLNQNPAKIQQTLKEVRPTAMCSVPRFWEKIAIGIQQEIEKMSAFQKGIVAWAVAVGKNYNIDHLRLKKCPNAWLWLRYQIANWFIFNKVKKTIGIENGQIFPTAGAAMDETLIGFFRSLGIPIVYGYGLTETFATVACFDYTNYRFGTVGKVLDGLEVKIGDDNEILVKGKTLATGYYKKPEATQQAFVGEWFRTGDAGKIDDTHLTLVERIKDLFKTSNGKYIAPQQIETRLGANPYIKQIAVIANNRNFVTAIIAPEMEPLENYARQHNITYCRIEELLENPQIYQLYEREIAENQKNMAHFEQIKKFRLIKNAFTIESGELTSTLKLRRAVIQHNYKKLIDEMYADTLTLIRN